MNINQKTAQEQISEIIDNSPGWKKDVLSRIREVILTADPRIIEEVKWKTASRPEGLPVWSHNGIICIAETWKDNIKLVFFKGAKMSDSKKLFNARLKSATDRAIEFHEGDNLDEQGLKELVKQAIELNN